MPRLPQRPPTRQSSAHLGPNVIVRVCHGCAILSRHIICANCRHTAAVYGARVWLPT